MATATAGFKFPGPVGTKRRRMRSGGNVSTMSNNEPVVTLAEADDVGEKIVQTSKCKGATTIPIFLKSKSQRKNKASGFCTPKGTWQISPFQGAGQRGLFTRNRDWLERGVSGKRSPLLPCI